MTPTPWSSSINAFHSFLNSIYPPLSYPNSISAGTAIITMTMDSIMNSGSSNLVPASSPSLLAWCLRCSNASAISTFSVSLRFFEPFLRFCSKRLPSFIYCCSPMRLPNSMNAFPSGTPPLIWQLVSYIS